MWTRVCLYSKARLSKSAPGGPLKGREGRECLIPSFPYAGADSEGGGRKRGCTPVGLGNKHSVCSEGRGQEGKPWPWACARRKCGTQRTGVGLKAGLADLVLNALPWLAPEPSMPWYVCRLERFCLSIPFYPAASERKKATKNYAHMRWSKGAVRSPLTCISS